MRVLLRSIRCTGAGRSGLPPVRCAQVQRPSPERTPPAAGQVKQQLGSARAARAERESRPTFQKFAQSVYEKTAKKNFFTALVLVGTVGFLCIRCGCFVWSADVCLILECSLFFWVISLWTEKLTASLHGTVWLFVRAGCESKRNANIDNKCFLPTCFGIPATVMHFFLWAIVEFEWVKLQNVQSQSMLLKINW